MLTILKPLNFDATTAREVIGDPLSRTVETKARSDADAGLFDPPRQSACTYWGEVQAHMLDVVYMTQHQKRNARNKRNFYMVCDKHLERTAAASIRASGTACHLADSGHTLLPFIVAHAGCPVRIVSEHEKDGVDERFVDWIA